MNSPPANATVLACLVAAAFAAGCGADAGPGPDTAAPLGVVSAFDGNRATILARLDPRTLRPRGPQVEVGEYHDAWSLSPDGSRVALGTGGLGLGIRIADVARMRVLRDVRTGIAAEALAWVAPRRLLALLQSGHVISVDPETGRVLSRRAVPLRTQCRSQPTAVVGGRWLLLLAPAGRTPARLAVVDAEGRMRTVSLSRIRIAGACPRGDLAVDTARGLVLVMGAGATVAEVDLRDLRVSWHRVGGMRSWPGGRRQLAWLGARSLAASLRRGRRSDPRGVLLIDTRTWHSRIVDPGAGALRVAGGTLLVFDGHDRQTAIPGIGLRAYAADATPMFKALRGRAVSGVEVSGGRAYARTVDGVEIVAIASGAAAGTATRSPDPVELLE